MAVVIPDAVLASAGLTADEARRELAVALYARERLTEGQAAEVAGMDRRAFNTLLAERGIPIHYGVEELREDAERALGRRGRAGAAT
ncbi:MAG: UPF0175 family protein [Chloroflexota bacterium]|nr:UPF0175 family protein [Chloroflexota bacterium]